MIALFLKNNSLLGILQEDERNIRYHQTCIDKVYQQAKESGEFHGEISLNLHQNLEDFIVPDGWTMFKTERHVNRSFVDLYKIFQKASELDEELIIICSPSVPCYRAIQRMTSYFIPFNVGAVSFCSRNFNKNTEDGLYKINSSAFNLYYATKFSISSVNLILYNMVKSFSEDTVTEFTIDINAFIGQIFMLNNLQFGMHSPSLVQPISSKTRVENYPSNEFDAMTLYKSGHHSRYI